MNILFSKTDAFGDALLATGFCRHIIQSTGCTRFFWLIRGGYESIATLWNGSLVISPSCELSPRQAARETLKQLATHTVGRAPIFIPTDMDPYKPWPHDRDFAATLAWWGDFVRELNPSLAIAGTRTLNWVDWYLTLASGARRRVALHPGVPNQEVDPAITTLLDKRGCRRNFTILAETPPDLHEVDCYHALCRALGLADGVLSVHPDISTASLPPDWSISGAVILSPGAGDLRRCWPAQGFAAVARRLIDGHGIAPERILVLAGPADAAVAAHLGKCLQAEGVRAKILQSGPCELPRLAKLLSKATLVLSNEAFVVHLAAAVNAPTVAIWGGGHWGRFNPRQGHVTVVHQPLPCYRCDWNCIFSECRCITGVSAEVVSAAVTDRLKKPHAPVNYVVAPPTVTTEEILARFHKLHHELTAVRRRADGLENWLKSEIAAKELALTRVEAAESEKAKAQQWARDEQAARSRAEFHTAEERRAKESALEWAHAAESEKAKAQQWARDEQAINRRREEELERLSAWIQVRSTLWGAFSHFLAVMFRRRGRNER